MATRMFCVQIIGFVAFLTAFHCKWMCSDNTNVITNGNTVRITNSEWCTVWCKYKTEAVNTNSNRYYEFTILGASFGVLYGLSIETSTNEGKKGIYFGTVGCSDGVWNNYNIPTQNLKNGDKIGFLTEETENDLKVYLYINKHPLGMIYHLSPKPALPLYPYVKSLRKHSVSIAEIETLPTDREMERLPIEGFYQLYKYSESSGAEVEFTEEWRVYTFEFILSYPRPYRLGVKADPKKIAINIKFNDFDTLCFTSKQNKKWSKLECRNQDIPLSSGESSEANNFIEEFLSNGSPYDINESENMITISSTVGSKIILKQIGLRSGAAVTRSPFEN